MKTKLSYRLLAALVVLALAGGGAYLFFAPAAQKNATAYFDTAAGIHPGDDVRVLGVRVGKVDDVTPDGTQVKVSFHYDATRTLPADAGVALVAPNLVGGRYLQLAPVYRGGPVLADGAEIPKQRTVEPASWDQVSAELTQLSDALGPNGANRQGALSRVLQAGAANLGGNGADFSQLLHQLSGASATLAGGSGDLFATIRNLNDFTTALNASQQQTRTFATQLASLSTLANDNRAQLASALSSADRALTTITDFVAKHKAELGDTVGALTDVAGTLARSRDDLANVLHAAPQTLANLYNIYEPSTGSASTRFVVPYTSSLSSLVCQAIYSVGGTIDTCRSALQPLLGPLSTPYPPVGVSPLVRPGTSQQQGSGR
ncbi:MCE family protein [Amycolatopsis sp. K13G38]|uniref:MCE family protein n=1 Tax=Amycolatopsis acididurans TaxID=2724524 RepID=A0ABX1IW28_9PSEU|nr:MCE family protein [Amycolatopsis acididurans]NKQ51673.1 MCE family protein [Amycolatopsis acididurans]